MGSYMCYKATMPHGVKSLVFLLAVVARAQDYYEDYLEPQQGDDSDVDKRAWNSGFNSGMGKRSELVGQLLKRAWNSNFSGGLGKRAWNSAFSSGMGKRKWNSGFSGGMGKRSSAGVAESLPGV